MDNAADRAVERVGQGLEWTGIPRMPARVFAFLLLTAEETCTARIIADGLQVSPGAVSGAVRYLESTRLISRERVPGGRGDQYRLADRDVWATITRARLPMLEEILSGLDEAAALLGGSTRGAADPAEHRGVARIQETREFFAFMEVEFTAMLDRWDELKSGPR